jgi:hypothetical protein
VYIYVKIDAGKLFIQEIRFDNEKWILTPI